MRYALFVISFWLALVRGEEKLRSVKTLSSTWGVGTIVADFARQFFSRLTFRVPHPCEIHRLSFFLVCDGSSRTKVKAGESP